MSNGGRASPLSSSSPLHLGRVVSNGSSSNRNLEPSQELKSLKQRPGSNTEISKKRIKIVSNKIIFLLNNACECSLF